MTFKELETALNSGAYDEKTQKKMELVYNATATLTSSIRNLLMENEMLRENTEQFLKHKKFKDALLYTIMETLEHKECPHHLRRSELQILIDENANIIEHKEVVGKIHDGLMACICAEKVDNEINFMLQEVLVDYLNSVHKSTMKKNTI